MVAFLSSRRGITPVFGYTAPHPSGRGTSTLRIKTLPSTHCGPVRHPLAFGPFPGSPVIGPTLLPLISRRGEEGFSSCLACPCHRAVASTPPK